MKNIKRLTATATFIVFTTFAMAQTPPPPNNGTTGSGGRTPVGGGAPLADGIIMLITASVFYGLHKYNLGKNENLNFDEHTFK